MFAYEQVQQVWWDDALCNDGTGALLDLFFSEQLDDIATAKAFCAACPVREACLEFALSSRQADGVWGGLTEAELAKIVSEAHIVETEALRET